MRFLKWLWRQLEMGAMMTDPEAYAAIHKDDEDEEPSWNHKNTTM